MKIRESDHTSAVSVKEALEDVEEADPVQKMNLEFLRKNLGVQDQEGFEELMDELEEVEDLKRKHRLKILEIMPKYEQEVKALFSKERLKLDDDAVQQIVSICQSYKTA